ncbi:Cpsf100 [Bugula neritina]|uniref:Cleavage and polyadenylation specificity factor subunit 2 n=1 Tax=Bugula neritina TaxID=10212 RepID=A0A7J7K201_BUGNE|nr:Cpsf100 [Bugula neritina]
MAIIIIKLVLRATISLWANITCGDMTSIIKFTALQGALDEGPLAYHLQIDDFNLLLDCGWDEDFTEEKLQPLISVCGKLDAVLLTYPDLYHLGAIPYLVGKGHLTCPVYATMPVNKMGQLFMYDLYLSRHNYEEFDLFTLDDIDNAFDKMVTLKYSQTVSFSGTGQGIRAIPLAAGHMIGGAIWRIVKDGDEDIVYAVDFNHKKERHLNGCSFDALSRPSLLITDAFNANVQQEKRRDKDGRLLTEMIQALRRKGNVLVAVDTAGRSLELIQLLETLWRNPESGLMVYSIALLNNVCYNVLEFAKSQMEWMSDKIIRSFEDKRNNPFNFRHIKCCHTMADVDQLPEPKVVLTSVPDLQSGFSRELFVRWCENPQNSIILTSQTSSSTLSRQLIDSPSVKQLHINVKSRVKLDGEELAEYHKKKMEEKMEEERLRAEHEDQEDSESELSDEEPEAHIPGEKQDQHDLLLTNTHTKSRSGFFKQAKKMFPMFPYVEEVLKWDQYGEIIKLENFQFSEVKLVDPPLQMAPSLELEPGRAEEIMEVDEEVTGVEDDNIPTKCVATPRTLNIAAKIVYIDFEGRSDNKSVKELLEKMKPRQLILIHGTQDSTMSLAKYCRDNEVCLGEIFTPGVGE